ncbi:hypothetical protein CEXT_716931 [Caerostris extrusa]|uniref:Uncharacterized protein n=1 Tax=Caerostris extrusa TaxID=172846 RepID=A0AAV4TMG4_CAEEX|nr:hypothetical protein CEXT_716931 [Caerostris extrusa]
MHELGYWYFYDDGQPFDVSTFFLGMSFQKKSGVESLRNERTAKENKPIRRSDFQVFRFKGHVTPLRPSRITLQKHVQNGDFKKRLVGKERNTSKIKCLCHTARCDYADAFKY